ncbi:MAG: HU family DNA-binding protein [Phocaeicola sp.]
MAIQFDFYLNPSATQENKQYHPRIVNKAPLETEEILELINHRCSLTPSDVVACLTELSRIISDGLDQGRTVHLDGIGSFNVALHSTAQEVTPKTRAEHVEVKGITFKAAQRLKKRLSTTKLERIAQKRHSNLVTNQEIEEAIELHFTTQHTLTRLQLERLCNLTRSTALRHINRLISQGKLVNINSKNQPIYISGAK